jgi:hypothetical protein
MNTATDTLLSKTVKTGGGWNGGQSTSDLVGFYGTTPIAQRSGSAQAAVGTTASTTTTPFGFATSTQADSIVTLVNEIRAALVAVGIIKGSA